MVGDAGSADPGLGRLGASLFSGDGMFRTVGPVYQCLSSFQRPLAQIMLGCADIAPVDRLKRLAASCC
eukprot:10378180-Lingulodinium_polyedra.AAC.1